MKGDRVRDRTTTYRRWRAGRGPRHGDRHRRGWVQNSHSPHVANLGKGSRSLSGGSPGSTTTLPVGNPTELLDDWAACMQSHGDPDQADPTIDTNNVIHVSSPPRPTKA